MRSGPPLLYAATAGGLALTTRAMLGHPIPLPLAAGYLGGYLALVALGSMVPAMGMWGDVLTSVGSARGVALTFDDGPDDVHTLRVADVLERFGARATFFEIGEKILRSPSISRELVARGHELGVHGHRIDRFLGFRTLGAVTDDLRRARDTIEQITGTKARYFRPPYGVLNPRIVRAANDLDLDVVGWNVRALDGVARTSAETVVRRVIPGLRDGSIVCMHDSPESGDRVPVAPEALPPILSAMDDRRLPGVTVTALLASAGDVAEEREKPARGPDR